MFRNAMIAIATIAALSTAAKAEEVSKEAFFSDQECSVTEAAIAGFAGAVAGYTVGSALSASSFDGRVVSSMPTEMFNAVKQELGDIENVWLTEPRGPGWKELGTVEDLSDTTSFSGAEKLISLVYGMMGASVGAGASYAAVCKTNSKGRGRVDRKSCYKSRRSVLQR